MNPPAYSVASLAKRWDCSPRHIYNMIRRGQLMAFNIGRLARITAAEVERVESTVSQPPPKIPDADPVPWVQRFHIPPSERKTFDKLRKLTAKPKEK